MAPVKRMPTRRTPNGILPSVSAISRSALKGLRVERSHSDSEVANLRASRGRVSHSVGRRGIRRQRGYNSSPKSRSQPRRSIRLLNFRRKLINAEYVAKTVVKLPQVYQVVDELRERNRFVNILSRALPSSESGGHQDNSVETSLSTVTSALCNLSVNSTESQNPSLLTGCDNIDTIFVQFGEDIETVPIDEVNSFIDHFGQFLNAQRTFNDPAHALIWQNLLTYFKTVQLL